MPLQADQHAMSQNELFDINVIHEVDSTTQFDGADLKRIARCDDGRDYACKRIEDGPAIPISEWMGYHLWRACGLYTPDFAILNYQDGSPPAFGSRIELLASQVEKDPAAYTVTGFFRPHVKTLSIAYPLDAFYVNPDRHGRNFLERPTLTSPELLCFDFSRAWATNGSPWGDEHQMHVSNTRDWWRFFRRAMRISANFSALERASTLGVDWFESKLMAAPEQWLSVIQADKAIEFWHHSRNAQIAFAKAWIELP